MTSRQCAGGYGGSMGRRLRSRDPATPLPHPPLVTSARESSEIDARAIAAGIPSRALMQRAGAAAAGEIARLRHRCGAPSVLIYAGSGNNGGDGWVVARSLAASGVRVAVVPVGEPRTEDARAERALAEAESLVHVLPFGDDAGATEWGAPGLIVDALLGTGAKGPPRDTVALAIARIARAREQGGGGVGGGGGGALVVSLDIPSGVDADSGAAEHAVRADVTLTFGTLKRGLLVAREAAGRIVLFDIGLPRGGSGAGYEMALVTAPWVHALIPRMPADAHKGTRKKLVIVGGQVGMAGAPVLAARAAMRSGIGMVRVVVAPASLAAVQSSEPHVLARAWPAESEGGWGEDDAIGDWADVVLVGPGLGDSAHSRELVERVLRSWAGPVVLDADALNVFKGEPAALAALLASRPALLTPHIMEFSRLASVSAVDVLERRFDVGVDLARRVGATVLLKGVPTIVAAADGTRLVSAAGTPALAAAGSGDLLGGVAATLLGQLGDAQRAGAAAAWVHGRAAELAGRGRGVRGVTLGDIERAISRVWSEDPARPIYPALAELPAVGDP